MIRVVTLVTGGEEVYVFDHADNMSIQTISDRQYLIVKAGGVCLGLFPEGYWISAVRDRSND